MSIPGQKWFAQHATLRGSLPVLSFFFIFLPIAFGQILTNHSHLDLPWPGRQVIPSILFVRGALGTDFLAGSTSDSVYSISATFMSALFPANTDEMLAMYDTLSVVLQYTSLWISVILLVRFCSFFWISNQLSSKKSLTAIRIFLYAYFSFLLGGLADKLIYVKALYILRPAHVADWNFPVSDALNPSGLAFLLVALALIPCFSSRRLETPAPKNTKRLLVTTFLVFLIASLIHPVVPLFGLGLLLVSWLIFLGTEGIDNRWLRLVLTASCAWVIAVVCLKIMFPQASINPAEFYSIYVEQRHPHHYLPSFYLKASIKLIIVNFTILFGTLLLTTKYARLRPIRKLALATIAVFVAVNGIQYIFVEYLHLRSFVELGITRVMGLYEFLYSGMLALLLLSVLQQLRKRIKVFARLPSLESRQPARTLPLIVWPVSAVAVIVIVMAAGSHFKMAYSSISTSNERLLQEAFDKNAIPYPRQVMVDDRLQGKEALNDLREVGDFDVYSDAYFPFSMDRIIEWNNRRVATSSFLKCLKGQNSLVLCPFRHEVSEPIYFIAKLPYKGMTPAFSADINGTEVYIYLL